MLIPAPAPPAEDPDYVWDVFYHRARLNEYDKIGNIGTLWVFLLSFSLITWLTVSTSSGRAYLRLSPTRFLQSQSPSQKTRPTKTLMVKLKTSSLVMLVTDLRTAEEYYKNDYPDEESPDSSEGSGKYMPMFISFGISSFWHVDAFQELSDYDEMLRDDDSDTAWR